MASPQQQGKAEEMDDETAFQQGPFGYGPRVFSKVRRSFVSCSTTAVQAMGFEICSVLGFIYIPTCAADVRSRLLRQH